MVDEKSLDRAFNKVLHDQKRVVERVEAERPLTDAQKQAEEQGRLRQADAPMTTADAIERILLADKDKDYFRLLELPVPTVDAADRPKWDCSASDISKAYRKLSTLVHPDKNPGTGARNAFEALNKAHRLLRDPGKREEILSQSLEAARKRQDKLEAEATPEERQMLIAGRRNERMQLQHQEAEDFAMKVVRERKEMQDRIKRKRELQERASRRNKEASPADNEDSDEAPDEPYRKKVTSQLDRRKAKQRFIF